MSVAPDPGVTAGSDLAYEMRGPRALRVAVAGFLITFLPAHLGAARDAWGLSAVQLPTPEDGAILPFVPDDLDRAPLVAVNSGRMTQRGIDFDGSDPVYRSTYPVRVYAWVKAEGNREVQDMRDDFATVVRACILSHLNLGTGGWLVAVPSSLVMDFSDVTRVKGERHVAGAYVGFEVLATETLSDRLAAPGALPRDTVASVNVTGVIVPPTHPALL